ncbi:MAG: sulfite exporter TauE/SafE family protein [Myxococcaceae bacterium]|nr:sulfite exporter TauE/SafE family protein [Myxococcaceae bacterium]
MTPALFSLTVFGFSLFAGTVGSLLGIGGGLLIVPFLTLALGVDIRYAIGASIVSVIATSSGAAAGYVRERLTNIRVAMFLEVATTAGAITGAFTAALVGGKWLFLLFGTIIAYSAVSMLLKMLPRAKPMRGMPPDRLSDVLGLHGSYYDEAEGGEVSYKVTRAPLGFALMYCAGVSSGLLGIGSGALKVPALDLGMRLPIKVSTATSNFMIGVTAAASAGVYFARGDIDPFVAAPVAAGVVMGAFFGSKLLKHIRASVIRVMFVAVLLWISWQMFSKGLA